MSLEPWPVLPPVKEMYADESRPGDSGRTRHSMIMYQHCLWKGLQFGSVLGIAAGTPYAMFREKLRGGPLVARVATIAACSSGVVMFASLGMCYNTLRKATSESIFDRAYRMNHNQEQNRCDWFTVTTSAGCATTAWITKFSRTTRGLASVGFAGFGLGIFLHVLTKPIFAPKKK